jgi:nucleotide-binding universal stress UspA family protein
LNTHDIEPILLCYDRSVGSRRAIDVAAAISPGRTAIVLYVCGHISVRGALAGSAGHNTDEAARGAMRVAEEGAELAVAGGLLATADAVSAHFDGTWSTIVRYAVRREAGLIVLGARGLSPVRSLLFGSVSHDVVQHAHCPVLVVPPVARLEIQAAPPPAQGLLIGS